MHNLIMTITDTGVSQRGAPQPQLCCHQRPTRRHPPSLLPAPHSSCRPPGRRGRGGLPLLLGAVGNCTVLLRKLWKGLNKAGDDGCPSSQGQKATEMSPWSGRPSGSSAPSKAESSHGPPSHQALLLLPSLLSLLWGSFKGHLVHTSAAKE